MKSFRRPRDETDRLRRRVRKLSHDRKLLREEMGSLLDLVPLSNVVEDIPEGTLRMLLQGEFVPHIAQLLATCMVAFKGTNLVEWSVRDAHGRGDFLLTLQRAAGKSPMQLKREAEERLTEIQMRWYELLGAIGPTLLAYEAHERTLEQLLDTLHAAIRTAVMPIGSPFQRMMADITNLVRKEDFEEVPPHLLAARVERMFVERLAARTLLDDPVVATAMQRHAVLAALYAAYIETRGIRGNQETAQETDPAAEARP